MMNILNYSKENLKCLCVFEPDVIKLPFIAFPFKFSVMFVLKFLSHCPAPRACVCVWLLIMYFISRSKGHSPACMS